MDDELEVGSPKFEDIKSMSIRTSNFVLQSSN